jgi:uncharacterized protein YyaL (SSP411 family)
LDLEALHWARDLQAMQDQLFWDDDTGGYFYSEADATNVVVRMKEGGFILDSFQKGI